MPKTPEKFDFSKEEERQKDESLPETKQEKLIDSAKEEAESIGKGIENEEEKRLLNLLKVELEQIKPNENGELYVKIPFKNCSFSMDVYRDFTESEIEELKLDEFKIQIINFLNKGQIYKMREGNLIKSLFIKFEKCHDFYIKLPFYAIDEDSGYISDEVEIAISNNAVRMGCYKDERPGKHFKSVGFDEKKRTWAETTILIEDVKSIPKDRRDKFFNEMDMKKAVQIAPVQKEIYDDLLSKYAQINNEENVLVEKNEQRLNLLKELGNYPDSALIKEYVSMLKHELRQSAYAYRDYSIGELKNEANAVAKEIVQKDEERFLVHRIIENFAYKFRFGQGKTKTLLDIFTKINQIEGAKLLISGKIYLNANDAKTYDINLGLSAMSEIDHREEEFSAELPDYESFVKEGNSFNDDFVLADKIIKEIKQEYPTLSLENKFEETGTTHFKYRSAHIEIDIRSLTSVALESNLEKDVILKKIAEIAKSVIESGND